MTGVTIEVRSYSYDDNIYVIYNTLRPESMLKKKPNSIDYNFVRDVVEAK